MSLLTTFNYSNHQSEGEEVVVESRGEKVRKLKLTWCTCCLLELGLIFLTWLVRLHCMLPARLVI